MIKDLTDEQKQALIMHELMHKFLNPRGYGMKMFYVSVWLEQDKDNDEPNYKYVRFTKQRYSTAHRRLTNEAIKKFQGWGRVVVELKE